MTAPFRKISARIWTPLLEQFSQRIDSACLRRDVWLTKVLEEELSHLDAEVTEANSDAAQRFIATHLDTVPRKLVTLTLPDELVRRLDELCAAKRLVRDSFFNRLFYLSTLNHRQVTDLFFDGECGWLDELLETTDFSTRAVGDLLSPVPGFRNPFETIREGLSAERDRLAREPHGRDTADECLGRHSIYRMMIADGRYGHGILYGLSLHLADHFVPGTQEYAATTALLDEFGPKSAASTEGTP
jgi:hypothetical protein